MRVLHWNISYSSQKEKIAEYISTAMWDNDTVVCLQEVMEATFSCIMNKLGLGYDYVYSLHFRKPGKYDGKNRKLGVLIICPKTMYIVDSGVMSRTPFPDRTAYAEILYNGHIYRILSLHSITGCAYSKAKSSQFYSFAETVDTFKPDIVTIDANEPKTDHYDPEQIEFYDNQDKGDGARTFFLAMNSIGLKDAYADLYDRSGYVPGKPLATSIKVNRKGDCRYDFLFANTSLLTVRSCRYLYEEGLANTSDHAMIEAVLEPNEQKGRNADLLLDNSFKPYSRLNESTLLKFCRYYKKDVPGDVSNMAQYERIWVENILQHNDRAEFYVTPEDLHELELFNPGDGVPLTLKALLFNRWCHWSSYGTFNDFKHWYLEFYLAG